MATFLFVLTVLIWIVCPLLVGLILLQGGAGDISSAFGGGGSLDSTLGVGAGRKMSKITAWLASFFLIAVTILAIPHHGSLSGYTKDDKKADKTDKTGKTEKIAPPTTVPTAPGQGKPADLPAPVTVPTAPGTPTDKPADASAPATPAVPSLVVKPGETIQPAQPTPDKTTGEKPVPVVAPPAAVPAPAPAPTGTEPPRSGLKLEDPPKN
jgi:protein translocase SecG subunit